MKDYRTCFACSGTGKLPISTVYHTTLDLLRRQRKPINGADLAALAGCEGAAMCNRLRYLEDHGFATAERRGRERLWVAK